MLFIFMATTELKESCGKNQSTAYLSYDIKAAKSEILTK